MKHEADNSERDEIGGHETEFGEYMVSRRSGLVRFAYGLTGDRGHAEDLAQTALARAYASWPRVRRAEDPDAYVSRILINANHRASANAGSPSTPARRRPNPPSPTAPRRSTSAKRSWRRS